MKKYYIDCEFDGHDGPLLSFGMVREDGYGIHIQTTESAKDPWVIANVMPIMREHHAHISATVSANEVGERLRWFMRGEASPVIVADSPVDIGRFCRAISTGDDGSWHSCGYDSISFKVLNVDCYPTSLSDAVQHNAWWDAVALMQKANELRL